MAQASSAQREPSMEEILASIRRIIEDSDIEKKRDADETGVITAPANDVAERPQELEAFRAEFRDSPEPSSPVEETVAKTQPQAGDTPPVDDEWTAELALPSLSERRHLSEGFDLPAEQGLADEKFEPTVREEKVDALPSNQPASTMKVEEHQTREPAPPVKSAEVATSADADGAQEESSPRLSLISERAGRQVAAAFGELSEAFAASRRRSFDEMAEEMLRPMLQDWLDNNLPHLVERLVREEIERIARG